MEDTTRNRPADAAATPETTTPAQPAAAQPVAPVTDPVPGGTPVEPASEKGKGKGRSLSVLATSLIGGGALVLGLVIGGGTVALATHDDRGDDRGMHQEWQGERFGGGERGGFDGQRPGGRGEHGDRGDRGAGPSAQDGDASEGRSQVRPDEDAGSTDERPGRSPRDRSDAPQDESSDAPSQDATPEQDPAGQA
ncbi:hypothetical protein J1G42_12240 [Cellulomonas sp. zg-ZUI222]|uniref:hypothetical protein n=1 Tax=Cellulomonas TaxID=1707 RepID=UPI001A94CE1E|nr:MULTISPECIES: hypothetical protein [Cellulomonas]MBO0900937.1 hypothetical protein [Cellulomonas sp. zg-ZUI22]MBO0921592.1 hypothetical protein [Cellulomonas wangleii]